MNYKLMSPDGRFDIKCILDKTSIYYCINFDGDSIIERSNIGFILRDELSNSYAFRDGFIFESEERKEHRGSWKPLYGERSVYEDNYNELRINFGNTKNIHLSLQLIFRAYNEGVAFRCKIEDKEQKDICIEKEAIEFILPKDYYCYDTYMAQGEYTKTPISNIKPGCERPLVIEGDNCFIAIGEAELTDYARMKFAPIKGGIITDLSSCVIQNKEVKTPWRYIMAAETPGKLLENNYIVLNLNTPCKIEDTSYIKPGKVIREVTLTTQGGIACVDFAVRHNLQYVEFDAGWYGYEYDDESDASFVSLDPRRSKGPFDLQKIIDYANKKGIGIILYVNQRALTKQLEQILPIYKKWGVKGIKFGFVNVGSQKDTIWLHEAVKKCAEYEMLVDIHDEYRPTGFSRTFPNLLTQEGIRGDEEHQPNSNTLTIAFTRMIAGAADNTVCYFDKRVEEQSSHAYQLAKSVVLYSPLQFLYWYDLPLQSIDAENSNKDIKSYKVIDESCPELVFFDVLPTVWDDTKVLEGEIGKHIIVARKSGDNWFVGIMNANKPYKAKVDLSFLSPNEKYKAMICRDDMGMDTKTKVALEYKTVTAQDKMVFDIEPNFGIAIYICHLSKDDCNM